MSDVQQSDAPDERAPDSSASVLETAEPDAGSDSTAPYNSEPDNTAVRVALWRAMHVLVDAEPHVLDDVIGLQLADPPEGWRDRGDMHPQGTAGFRASIVGRARFIEDLVEEQADAGVTQYVILGAGLDTLAQRRPDLGERIQVFEIEQPGTQAWKRRRLEEEGFVIPEWLHLVPVDFENGENREHGEHREHGETGETGASGGTWWDGLVAAGFEPDRPAVVVSTGVSMYLTKEATASTLRVLSGLAPGSTVAMTVMLPIELVDEADRPGLQMSAAGAARSGTPFISFYAPDEIVAVAHDAGFNEAEHLSSTVVADRYFSGREDGLRPSTGEDYLIART